MKNSLIKIVEAIFFCLVLSTLTGCAMFGNSKQMENQDWYGFTSADGVREIKDVIYQEKVNNLALKKLESLPVKGDAVNGYEGIVSNYNSSNRYTIQLSGPENKSYVLGPKDSTTDKLIPGVYVARTICDGRQQGNITTFRVGPQMNYYQGEQYHWFVYNE